MEKNRVAVKYVSATLAVANWSLRPKTGRREWMWLASCYLAALGLNILDAQ